MNLQKKGSVYTCAKCKETYPRMENKKWSTKLTYKEYMERFPEKLEERDFLVVICDDCYKLIMNN